MDRAQYFDSFLAESLELLQVLSADLLKLEKGPDNRELFNEILRSTHSLKGMAATMGFKRIAELAHEMEGTLILLKDYQVPVAPEAVDLLLKCLDTLQAMIDGIGSGREGKHDCQPLREALKRLQKMALAQADPDQLQHRVGISPRVVLPGNGPEGRASLSLRTVRVNTERLDSLLNLVGELVISRTRLERISGSIRNPELQEALERMGRLMSDMQSNIMKIRMVPIEQVFNLFPRMVRDLSRSLNKNIEFRMEGGETELDRTVLDEIGEPLVHLIRNAVDHGIELPEERLTAGKPETALITLAARQDSNNVIIEVTDDGRGIDLEQVRRKAVEDGLLAPDEEAGEAALLGFLFHPGFSTVKSVTDISGRGVGMDVVKTKVEALNGRVELETRAGLGTTVRIRFAGDNQASVCRRGSGFS